MEHEHPHEMDLRSTKLGRVDSKFDEKLKKCGGSFRCGGEGQRWKTVYIIRYLYFGKQKGRRGNAILSVKFHNEPSCKIS